MQVNVDISVAILDWVMAHVQIDILPSQIKEYLSLWKNGEKKPTFNQIEKTSRATGIPLGYFFLQTPPTEDLSFVDYRTIDSLTLENPSRNLIDTMHDMELVQEWTHDHLISDAAPVLSFVGAFKDQTDISFFADSVRKILNLPNNWFTKCRTTDDSFRLIRTAISNSGVIVMMSGIVGNNTHRALDISEFRAFTIVDNYAPLIFINANDSINGKLFSLLHEFAHICIGENSLFNDRYSIGTKVKKAETVCNAVAAEIIVPQAAFTQKWGAVINDMEVEQAISTLAKDFKCGITVIARKALDNGFIDYSVYSKIAQLAVKLYNERRKKEKEDNDSGGDYYRTAASRIDRRFFGMLVGSVAEGKTLYSDALRLTNTNRSTFATLVENAGGGAR